MRYPQSAAFHARAALRRVLHCRAVVVGLLLPLAGCTPLGEYIRNGFKVGPNYATPAAPVARDWIDGADTQVRKTNEDMSEWWKVFDDPELNSLVCAAYNQNLTLRQAGFAILQARAERAIAIGELFPQQQQATGDFLHQASSEQTVGRSASAAATRFFNQWDYGFNLSWEIDFWGRFRRAVEQANGNLDVSVANFDNVLVTLVSDVASAYVDMCTTKQRIVYVNMNASLQRLVYESVKLQPLATTVDRQQALSTLRQTEALLPPLLITLRQDSTKLSTLLGIPPEDLTTRLLLKKIPEAPAEAVVGIPADLLRRRPDVRSAERQAAAQSAMIGIAEAEFYPHIAINGTIGASASDFKHLFLPTAYDGTIGPNFQWNILNYGRILNGVRREDAIFKQLVTAYQNTVLSANAEVENALVLYLRSQDQYQKLKESADATQLAVKVLTIQMKDGLIDFNRMALLQQNLTQQLDQEAVALGNVSQGLIQIYRALGGGWEIRLTGACDPNGRCAAQFAAPVGMDSDPQEQPSSPPPGKGPNPGD